MRILATALLAVLLLTVSAGAEPVDTSAFEWIPTWKPPVVRTFPEIRSPDSTAPEPATLDWSETDLSLKLETLLAELPAAGRPADDVILDALHTFLAGRAVVAVSVILLPEGHKPPPTEAKAAIAALTDGKAELLWSGRFATRRGEWVEKNDLDVRTLVSWMEVEVAQEASIADPVRVELDLGTRVAVQCLPDNGGSATVRLSLQIAFSPENDETVRTSTGSIDLVEVPFVSLFAGMNLTHRVPKLLLVNHPAGEGLIAVTVNLVETPAPVDLPFLLVDLSAVAGEPEIEPCWKPSGIRTMWENPYECDPDPYLDARGKVISLAEGALNIRGYTITPTVFAFTGKGQDLGKAPLPLSPHSKDVERVRVRMPWAELQPSQHFDPVTGTLQAGFLPTDAFSLRLPVLDGTATLLHSGTWRLFLSSEKVEIAQAAAIHQPLVGIHFEGESLRLTGSRSTRVKQTTSRLIDRERREIDVRKDVLGRRDRERNHLIDYLRTLDSNRSLTVGPRGATTVRREEDEAVVEVWR